MRHYWDGGSHVLTCCLANNAAVVVDDEVGRKLTYKLGCHVCVEAPLRNHQQFNGVQVLRQKVHVRTAQC